MPAWRGSIRRIPAPTPTPTTARSRRRRPPPATSTAIRKHYLRNWARATRRRHQPGFRRRLRPYPPEQHERGTPRRSWATIRAASCRRCTCWPSSSWCCDHWFSSLPGPTWINRLFAHTGTSLGQISEPGSLFSSTAASLQRAHALRRDARRRRAVADLFRRRAAIARADASIGASRQLSPVCHWHDDVARGDLPAYTFIEPTYFGPNENDQHPPHDVLRGDALIADVYNTLRANPDLFARTLLIVLYDEHGGFFDHVVPPRTVAPDGHTDRYSFDRLGFRVPADLRLAAAGPRRGSRGVRSHQPAAHGERAVARRAAAGPAGQAGQRSARLARMAYIAAQRSARGEVGAGYPGRAPDGHAGGLQVVAVRPQPPSGEPDRASGPSRRPDGAGA